MRLFTVLLLAGLVSTIGGCMQDGDKSSNPVNEPTDTHRHDPASSSVLTGITLPDLDGDPVDMSRYDGQVVLLVNVASRCGNTPQYAGLQKLHERYADAGLVVVGVPSNDFGGQEPGSAEEIATFCETNYGVTFTMLDKVHVKGADKTELYQRLTDPANDPADGDEVQWNFEKFLVDRTGNVAGRFRSKVQPESDEMIAAIEQALAMQ